ncbi:MAG: metal ABC transporter permease [Flavobacteriales bacterium]|nr:metal ABC transporter permease [Flavobacteriales bacterium]HZW77261.1 iron chelate uptake ABC transporter family permease subunit [Flavobacteriaceae bacterium]
MWDSLKLIFTDYTVGVITCGTALLGAISGMLGCFAVLKKESLLGDAISHAALPGIVLAFLITGTKSSSGLLIGAFLSALLGLFWIRKIVTKTHLKTDTALGLVLSVFFGFGMVLLTFIQKMPDANQAGLDKFLFGQAATLMVEDVWMMGAVTTLSLFVVILFWKEFKIMLFDKDYAHSIGIKTKLLDALVSLLIVVAIVLGLQTVGVILMSAILLAPAAAARQWTNSLKNMVILAGIFGALSGITGTAISASSAHIPTGPVIVMVAAVIVIISLIFSPERGYLFKQIKHRRNRNDLKLKKTLQLMYNIAVSHKNVYHPHSVKLLNNFRGYSKKSIQQMQRDGWISITGGMWSITPKTFEYITQSKQQQI